MAVIKATNHIGLNVTDMEACIRFYGGLLGLRKISDEMMTGKFLDTVQGKPNMKYRIVKVASPEGFFIELLQDFNREVEPEHDNCLESAGLRHFAYEVDDVDAMYEKVTAFGCSTISKPTTSEDGSMRLFFVRDPEGSLIELMQFPKE